MCSNSGIKDAVLKDKFVEAYNEFVENRRFGDEEDIAEQELKRINKEENELISLNIRGLINKYDYEHDRAEMQDKRKKLEKRVREYKQAHMGRGSVKPIVGFDEDIMGRVIKGITIQDYVVTFEFYNK